jgi:hypothetical protein
MATITPPSRSTLIRGCALMSARDNHTHYFLGTSDRILSIRSSIQRSALIEIAHGRDPLTALSGSGNQELAEDIELFLHTLDTYGFLNQRPQSLALTQRTTTDSSAVDLAHHHLQRLAEPELAQSEWIDRASDCGTSTISARALHPIVLSGRSRVITILYSLLLASGVSRVRFLDRHYQTQVESYDLGCGVIGYGDLGLNYYEISEGARRSASLFPIDKSARYEIDTNEPIAIIHYGDCDPEDLVEWSNKSIPHLLIHRPIGDEIVLGPLVLPGESPCIRCFSLYERDNLGYTRLGRIDLNEVEELPFITAHYIAAIAASQILHFIDQLDKPEEGFTHHFPTRNYGLGEVIYINFQRLTQPQVVAIARHPLCGCDF